ncbi:HEAT repeat domain-containing protein [Merismopedia glauca]|uniref:Phycocyanobilin lyase n=1 Tax=Merismopedia glauca CCAP 1448/3 TaxID=1296344 RepID=A0A2T1C7T4_9CYAN|nr:HEAT repeat domain-containing protein [Merismopedia glauca]PSB04320.1 phycocyanobilin lyase [Merismopedia glauca CCAP 1448/3]
MSIDANTQKLIDKIERADNATRMVDAVRDLADNATIAATDTLIKVLAYNNPGAAVAAVDGLIAIGEPAVEPLLQELDGYNYGARAWAIRALAGIGDPRALNILLEAATEDFALSVRRGAARGLGTVLWDKMASQEVLESQKQVLKTLIQVCQDPEWVVRYAAVSGLEALGMVFKQSQPELAWQVMEKLRQIQEEETEIAVKVRSQSGIQQLSQLT